MNSEQFDKIVEERLEKIRALLIKKRAEYAPDGGDRLHNFRRAAAMIASTPESALVGMWVKHVVSILDIVDGIEKKVPAFGMIEEKVGDAINYLLLLEAMLKERLQDGAYADFSPGMSVSSGDSGKKFVSEYDHDFYQGALPESCRGHCPVYLKNKCLSTVERDSLQCRILLYSELSNCGKIFPK